MVILSLLHFVRRGPLESTEQRDLAVIESTMRAGQMTPLHTHSGDEALEVVDGTVTVCLGAEVIRLRAGDALVLPGRTPHAVRAEGRARIRTGSYVASVSRYEDFLRAVAASGPTGDSEDALRAIAGANGIRIVGPPGALPAARGEAAA
jgi:mannose-6-phosphate isomerase-like protein (cupin superfamily)